MKKLIFIFTICLASTSFIFAQHVEIGAFGGYSTYSGDLSPTSEKMSHGEFRYAIGGFVRYQMNDYFTAKAGLSLGRVSARDIDSENIGRKARRLEFKSVLMESAVTFEYNILGYDPEFLNKRFSPYLFAGIGVFTFNPKTLYQGQWVELQPLHTEGQGLAEFPGRKPYKKVAISFPFGIGIKFAVNDRINIGMEAGLRKTTTDYLDDVSTTYVSDDIINERYGVVAAALANRSGIAKETGDKRGSDEYNDWYAITGFTISYNIIDSGYPRKRRKPMGCPTF